MATVDSSGTAAGAQKIDRQPPFNEMRRGILLDASVEHEELVDSLRTNFELTTDVVCILKRLQALNTVMYATGGCDDMWLAKYFRDAYGSDFAVKGAEQPEQVSIVEGATA